MTRAVPSTRPALVGTRLAAVLAAPLAPPYGLLVAYLAFHPPRPRRRRAPAAFGLSPLELWITGSSARARLHAWRLPGDPRRVVVLGHGLGLDKSHSLAQARLLHRAGYTVLLFDFRNHGDSFRDRGLTRFSRRFDDDLVAVVDRVRAMPEHAHARIALWGFSFSTFPVLDTLAHLDGAVQAVICDSGPTRDLSIIIASLPRTSLLQVPRVLQTAPTRTLWQAVYQRLAMATLDPPTDWPPAARQGLASTPMLFLVGDRDAITPVDQVRAVAGQYPRAEVLIVPGAGHLQALKADRHAYTTTVLDFLARALDKDPGAAARTVQGNGERAPSRTPRQEEATTNTRRSSTDAHPSGRR
jgi:pimeloyl-ACP methyl ester carboxylesterase